MWQFNFSEQIMTVAFCQSYRKNKRGLIFS